MSLPEKKYPHKKKGRYDCGKDDCDHINIPCNCCPDCKNAIECWDNCPACIEAARDKEWAKWILGEKSSHEWSEPIFLNKADFEALKKLAEG